MPINKNICTTKGCLYYGSYCRIHIQGVEKKKTYIKPLSDKRARIQRQEYIPLVKMKLSANAKCAVQSPACTKVAQGLHHVAGKENAKKLVDSKNVVPCCNACNTYIESNTSWAKQNGWKESKHKPNYKREK
jgi:hypothetical protein